MEQERSAQSNRVQSETSLCVSVAPLFGAVSVPEETFLKVKSGHRDA